MKKTFASILSFVVVYVAAMQPAPIVLPDGESRVVSQGTGREPQQ